MRINVIKHARMCFNIIKHVRMRITVIGHARMCFNFILCYAFDLLGYARK